MEGIPSRPEAGHSRLAGGEGGQPGPGKVQLEEILYRQNLTVGHQKSTLLWITPICRTVAGEMGHLDFPQRLDGCNASCFFVLQDLSIKLIAAGGFEA